MNEKVHAYPCDSYTLCPTSNRTCCGIVKEPLKGQGTRRVHRRACAKCAAIVRRNFKSKYLREVYSEAVKRLKGGSK